MPINSLTSYLAREDHLQHLLDKLPAGAYLCDGDGLITYFNDHAVQVWGRAPALFDSVDRFCGSFRLFAADGRPISHDESWMALALKHGREYIGEEIIIERPDGSRRTVLAHAGPFQNADGKVAGAVNVLVDITDRKDAERAHTVPGAIVESSDDAIISNSLGGIILSWNTGAEKLFGYSAAEAVGQSIGIIIPPDKAEEEREFIARLTRGEKVDHYETTRATKHGARLEISVTISPLRDSTGKVIGASKIARDITARKQREAELVALQDALQEADIRKNEFLATLAHELRNPLAAVCNSLQLLALDDSLSPTVVQIREIMDQQSKQMIRLVDDLLDSSRIARGKIELRREFVDLASIVANAVQASRAFVESRKHQLSIQLPPRRVTLYVDAARIAQVLNNLLSNAAKYTPPGGQIWLSARPVNGGLELAVRDTGVGISAQELPKVFEIYMQAESSKANAVGGLGLGLALAKKLVELHDGRIEAISAGENKGAEFRVWLPAANLSKQPAIVQPPKPHAKLPSAAPLRILIVDDTFSAAFVLRILLEKLGHEVETAADAMAAIEAVRMYKPQVVFSDIAMPGIDGYELARRLKPMPEMSGVMLVALTGYGRDADRRDAEDAGFDRHLVKPISIQALQELLNEYEGAVV